MANEPISALTLFTSYSTADEVEIPDVSDATFASTGTNKRIPFSTLLTMAGVGSVAAGGTGLTAVGSADQLLGVAHTGGALQYKTLTAGSNITITPAAGSITIAASGGGNVSNQGLYNAMTYGATGNGTTDDTLAIQAALNAAYSAGGGIVYLPPGTYMITNKLLLQTGCRLTGDGYASTILANLRVGFIDPQEGVDIHPTVEVPQFNYGTCTDNLRFVAPPGADIRIYGWHGFEESFNNKVHHCRFENYTSTQGGSVDPSNSYCNIIESNFFSGCAVGVFLTGTSYQYGNVIANNTFDTCQTAIEGEYPWYATIIGNHISAVNYGLNLSGSYNSIGGSCIAGNTVEVSATNGIGISLGSAGNANTTISNNTINCSGTGSTLGINCDACVSIVISGNQVQAGSSGIGIGVRQGSNNCLVTSNNVNGSYYGITVDLTGTATGNVLSGNLISNATDGIVLSTGATNTVITGNTFNKVTTPLNLGASIGTILGYNPRAGVETVTLSDQYALIGSHAAKGALTTSTHATALYGFLAAGASVSTASTNYLFSAGLFADEGVYRIRREDGTNCLGLDRSGNVSLPGNIGVNGATPPAKAASPGTATSTDATVINAISAILRALGFCS